MSRTIWPEILGFLAAAAFATLVLAVSVPFGSVYDDDYFESVLVLLLLYLPFALVAVVALGVPTLVLLYRFRPGRWWMPVVAGLILGVPLLLALPGQPDLANALIFVPLSALSALVFWFVWRWLSEREGACCAS
jgi:hypothetical protein